MMYTIYTSEQYYMYQNYSTNTLNGKDVYVMAYYSLHHNSAAVMFS